ncbi:hypothetical protein DACRYDRAFT_104754 [Dacryopinax primogenitus]|uniref:Large ribosomal subunit protein mL44 n=1 Tax=Dacryopinax primogenitus (strain DJM 731) TaxID=1858805 RepID=M5GDV1_DACPD|nr:uncharacterized protein DACRYDRAFT_104754 [Dacryopinax primogenitus]EJU04862.1 hypothetical protein DACRYDRAFT_104754 [Dacryopinax primogenitus]
MAPRARSGQISSLASSSSRSLSSCLPRPTLACSSPTLRRQVQTFRPPPESRTITPGSNPETFNSEVHFALQPPPNSQVTAFAYRVGLLPPRSSEALEKKIVPLARQVCTHPSYIPFWRQHRPGQPVPPTNAPLDVLGNSLLGLFAAEYVHSTWPHLPTKATKAAVSAYVGPNTLAAVARELGAGPLLRWQRAARTETTTSLVLTDALMTVPRSLVGLIYQLNSITEARKFAEAFFLSRQVDLRTLLKFVDPKLSLVDVLYKFGWDKPVTRLLSESGRRTATPVFVVGVYSGATKIGESFGSSLKMAEYRACEDALWRLYLTQAPKGSYTIPSATFDWAGKDALFHAADYLDNAVSEVPAWEGEGQAGVGPEVAAAVYLPPLLGESEVQRDLKELNEKEGTRRKERWRKLLSEADRYVDGVEVLEMEPVIR